jgi:hypothetical protein
VLVNDTILIIVDHLGTFENRPIIYSWYFADSKKFYGMGTSEPDRWGVKGFIPATKEQREFLFQKMKEAGYEWDAEKKELKKIEQNNAWSKEDENLFRCAIDAIKQESKVRTDGCLDEEVGGMVIDWLKSLKERYTWKPSDKQMEAVRIAAEIGTANNSWAMGILKDMHQDLKKLREK